MRFSRSASYLARTASGSKLERSSLTPTVEPPRSRAPRSRTRSGHVDAWRAMVEHQRRDGREVRRHRLVRASRVARFDRVGDLLVRRIPLARRSARRADRGQGAESGRPRVGGGTVDDGELARDRHRAEPGGWAAQPVATFGEVVAPFERARLELVEREHREVAASAGLDDTAVAQTEEVG